MASFELQEHSSSILTSSVTATVNITRVKADLPPLLHGCVAVVVDFFFLLACVDLGGKLDESFSAYAFLFLFFLSFFSFLNIDEIARTNTTLQTREFERAETTVDERALTRCLCQCR